jgi:plastocyanin
MGWVGAAAALGAMLACGGGGGYGTNPPSSSCTPSGTTVCMTPSNTFNPTQITIQHGGSVTWSNTTGVTHNVTFAPVTGAPADIGNFASGSQSAAFPTAGTFAYHCTIHGASMSGTVVVQ